MDASIAAGVPEAMDSTDVSVPAPGRQLAARRQAAGWSIEQVAAQLKLASRQIEAIEAGHLEVLPGATVARGFIRSYAKLLKMDAAPLLAATPTDIRSPIDAIRQQGLLATPFSKTRLPSMKSHSTSPNWIAALFLVLLLGAGVWAAQRGNWLSGLPHAPWATADSGLTKAVLVGKTDAAPGLILPVTADVRGEAIPAPGTIANQADQLHVTVPALSVSSEVPPVESAGAAPTTTPSDNYLNLTVNQDSWIEIKRKDGSVLMSRVAKAGTKETFEIAEPVSLVVGNAAGVNAVLRNVPLDLKSVASTNVARVNLK